MSRATIIALSTLLLVGLVAGVVIAYLNYIDGDKKVTTTTKAVQEICQPTDYKEACFKSLGKVESDDPNVLIRAAFGSTIEEIGEVVNKSTVLNELEKDPKTAEAVKDCKELFQDSIDDLQRSFNEIGEFDLSKVDKILENIKIWLSASITYQETCLDGFDNTTGDASERVRKVLETSMQMSSNGLAIVTELSSLLGTLDVSSFNRRRLLVDDRQVMGHHHDNNIIPHWKKNRRLLSSAYRVEGHDNDDDVPSWLDGARRILLQNTTNLTDDLKTKANMTVAQDGSGKYKTIEEALNEIPKYGNESFIVYIKEGVYNEYLVLYKWMTHVVFVGDGPTKTRITNNKNFADGVKTFKTATLSVLGDFFIAKDIGIENSAGAIKHQAVALRVQSDQSIFYNCHMDGYQDTLYTHTYRQFYRDCRVTGTIDFIFGDAAAFFQNCTFVVRKPLENQRCIVTAQGRMERHQPTGIIIHKCRFEAEPDYYPVRKTNTAYLGRPWKEYSKTVIMESYIDESIALEGWLPWEGDFGLETCYYGEYNNVGPGSDMSNRVRWRGIKIIASARAEKLMPPMLYQNDDWIIASGVPYDPSLSTFASGPGSEFDEDLNAPEGAPFLTIPTFSSSSSSSTSSSSSHSSSSGSSSSGTSSTPSKGSSSSSSSSPFTHQGSYNNEASASTTTGSNTDSSTSTTTPSTGGSTGESSSTSGSSQSTGTSSLGSSSSSTSTGQSDSTSGSSQSSTTSGSTGSNQDGSTGESSQSIVSGSTASSDEGGSIGEPSYPTTISPIDAPTPSPISTDELTPSDTPTLPISISQTPASSPSSSQTNEEKRKLTGPITVRELERILMTNEEIEGEDDDANDDMSYNVPDGDEPSPAKVEFTGPTAGPLPGPGPTPTPISSIVVSPSTSPSMSPNSMSPSEEVGDWLPPGLAPEPDTEPADKAPPAKAPPKKSSSSRLTSKLNEYHVILSGMLIWITLAM